MSSPKTRGACAKCGRTFTNASMTRHLAGCVGTGAALHVAVDVGPGTWWMHLALAPTATLRDLDAFLRRTWLECCGHLSAFDVGKTRYESSNVAAWADYGWGPKPRSMAAKVSVAIPVGTTFDYEYDFGSTTELRGRALGLIAAGKAKVTLLARNEAIPWQCACDAPATRICSCCGATACDTCDAPCDCGDFEGMALPVVNSPRMGVCAYAG